MSTHSFDTEIALKVGVNAAVLYQNILFWTEKNLANNRHVHGDFVYTYNSVKAWGELFPYLSTSQIRTALKHLVDANLVVEENLNERKYDRTKWYGVCSQIHLSNLANGIDEIRKPIPDSKPDNKPDTNTSSKDDEVNYYFDQLWSLYPRKVGKGQARKAFKAASKKADFYDLLPKLMDYVQTLEGKDKQYIPHLATWLNGERWEDEVEA